VTITTAPSRGSIRAATGALIGAGPPTIGFVGMHVTVLRALVAVTVLLAVAAVFSAVVAPRRSGRS
jgi:NADH:ubiquinone oxidoreductase subunit 2 (subunit N)